MAEEVKTNIRIPAELYEQVKELAVEDLRSINAEIVALVREAVAARRGHRHSFGITDESKKPFQR